MNEDIKIRIGADAGNVDSVFNRIESRLNKSASKLTSIGTRLSLAITVPTALLGKSLISAAQDAEESENLFEVSMGKMAKQAREFSEELRSQFGLNAFETRKMTATFNVMTKAMGLTEETAFGMSSALTSLTFDMASFFNLRPEDSFLKLQAAISGEIEPLRRLGIIVSENTVKTELMNRGLITEGQVLSETQKVLGRFLVIAEQTSVAQGDLGRTILSSTNQMRILQSRWQDLQIQFGTEIIPLFDRVVKVFNILASVLLSLDPATKRLIITIAAFAGVVGPTLLLIGTFIKVLGLFINRWIVLAGVFALVAGAAYLVRDNWKEVETDLSDIFDNIVTAAALVFENKFGVDLPEELTKFKNRTTNAINEIVKKWENFKSVFTGVATEARLQLDLMATNFSSNFRNLKNDFNGFVDSIKGFFEKTMPDDMRKAAEELVNKIIDSIMGVLESIPQRIRDGFAAVTKGLKGLNPFSSDEPEGGGKKSSGNGAPQSSQGAIPKFFVPARKQFQESAEGMRDLSFAAKQLSLEGLAPLVDGVEGLAAGLERGSPTLGTLTQQIKSVVPDSVLLQNNLEKLMHVADELFASLSDPTMDSEDFSSMVDVYRQSKDELETLTRQLGNNIDAETAQYLSKVHARFVSFSERMRKTLKEEEEEEEESANRIKDVWLRAAMGIDKKAKPDLDPSSLKEFPLFPEQLKSLFDTFSTAFPETSKKMLPIMEQVGQLMFSTLAEGFEELEAEAKRRMQAIKDETEQAFRLTAGGAADVQKALAGLSGDYEKIKIRSDLFGNSVDVDSEKLAALTKRMQELIDKGVTPSNAQLALMSVEFDKLTSKIQIKNAFEQIGQTVAGTMATSVDAVVRGTQTMSEAFKNFTRNALLSLADRAFSFAINSLFSSIGKAASGAAGEGFLGTALGLIGTVFGGGKAQGGRVNPGTVYPIHEQGLPEFFVPDVSGRVVPLSKMGMVGGGGGGSNVQVNIINNTGEKTSTRESMRQGTRTIEVIVGDAISKDLAKGGVASQAISNTFGLARRGGGR